MTTAYATSTATYDGRASKEENFGERTGLARADGTPGGGHRSYHEAPLPDGSHELRTELISPAAGRAPAGAAR